MPTSRITKIKEHLGFSIIELIVVIAIIAVLASIVFGNVTQYIPKSKDTAIKEQIRQLAIAAADFYYRNGTFADMCAIGTKCAQIESNISNLGGQFNLLSIKTDGSAYCMDFVLSDGTSTWCVDNTGYSGSLDSCSPSYFACQ